MRVFACLGPDAPTIDDFTNEAGVARGMFCNYFETREDLWVAVATAISERLPVLRGEAGRAHADHVAQLVLTALSVDDAADIVRRPLNAAAIARRAEAGRPTSRDATLAGTGNQEVSHILDPKRKSAMRSPR